MAYAFDQVREAVFLLARDARVVYVNDAACRALGYSRAELLALSVPDLDPDFPPSRWESHWRELEVRRGLTFDGHHRAKDGRVLQVEISTSRFDFDGQGYIVALVRDASQRLRAEEADRERADHLHFFESLDRVNRAIQGARDLDRMLSDVLDAALSVLGCDRAYLLYPCDPEADTWTAPMERTRPEYPGALALGLALPADAHAKNTARRLLAADGPVASGPGTDQPIPDWLAKYSVRAGLTMALRPKVGKPWQFGVHQCSRARSWTPWDRRLLGEIGRRLEDGLTSLLTLRDLRQREEELRVLNAELERRVVERTGALENANRELEAFAYTVSHDLRAPARHVGSFLELLDRHAGPALDGRARHYLSTAAEAAARMGTLVDALLEFFRKRRHELVAVEVDLTALAHEVVEELEPDARGRAVRWQIGELPHVVGDRTLLRQVLANLLGNALKFTAPRAQAEIAVEAVAGPVGEHVFAVRDNGVGFDMAYAKRLFGVFERLHRSDEFDGLGIGLATVQRIVSRHGGRTWAEGKVGEGATFYVALPA